MLTINLRKTILLFLLAFTSNIRCNYDLKITSKLKLYNGVEIPRLGFGTAAIEKSKFNKIIESAVENGFRLFDSAEATQWYDDKLLGESLSKLSLERDEYFLVTKVFPLNYGQQSTRKSVLQALTNLQTDYIDLVLLHFPECWTSLCGDQEPEGTWKDALTVLADMLNEGIVRSIGVSNFDVSLLQEALKIYKPHVVQNWMDPLHKDNDVVEFCNERKIVYMGYSSLGGQWQHRGYLENPVFENDVISRIASSYNISIVEVVLKWGIQRGTVMIPRSNSIKNIVKNGKLFALFENDEDCKEHVLWLSEADMTEINNLPDL